MQIFILNDSEISIITHIQTIQGVNNNNQVIRYNMHAIRNTCYLISIKTKW